jgi:hypothetical protein
VLFRKDVLSAIGRGDVTAAFRRWRRPTVRSGGRLRTAVGVLAIESVEEVEARDISEHAARAAGYDSPDAARRDLAGTEGRVYQIRFRLIGDDPRVALRAAVIPDRAGFENVAAALRKLDRNGAWTQTVLDLIERNPGAHAKALAEELEMERLSFKRRVRQLKELGLTESLPVGYRLSPRGVSVLEYLRGEREP